MFITRSLTATTSPYFPGKGIASRTGRLDVIARMLRASLWTTKGVRKDAQFIVTLEGPPNPPLTLYFDGKSLDCDLRTEIDAIKCIRKCMLGLSKGCTRTRDSFEFVLKNLKMPIIFLKEGGEDVTSLKYFKTLAFVIGPQHDIDLPSDVRPSQVISIGKKSYLASHVISYINFYLDLKSNRIKIIK
nr:hypothetical protein [Ignicoccus islandicus]